MKTHLIAHRFLRPAMLVAGASMMMPTLAGCGNNASAPPPPREAMPGEMSRANQPVQQAKPGMSTGKKVAILAGAAALYYIYKRKQAKDNTPQNVQYYISKSTGRIYYRDPKTKQAIWMTPPPAEVKRLEVPMEEATRYREVPTLRGYENSQSGFDLDKYLNVQ